MFVYKEQGDGLDTGKAEFITDRYDMLFGS
jgi:hypothetical protein